ncbi:MAG: hypothetical protein WCV63_03970 [Negativicutes bacterium]|jgi:hypothetical protein
MNEMILGRLDRLKHIGVVDERQADNWQCLLATYEISKKLSIGETALLYHEKQAAIQTLNLLFADVGLVFDEELLNRIGIVNFEYAEHFSVRIKYADGFSDAASNGISEMQIAVKDTENVFNTLENYLADFSKKNQLAKITIALPAELLRAGPIALFPMISDTWSEKIFVRLNHCIAACYLAASAGVPQFLFQKLLKQELWSRGIADIAVLLPVSTNENYDATAVKLRLSSISAACTQTDTFEMVQPFAEKLLDATVLFCKHSETDSLGEWRMPLMRFLADKHEVSPVDRRNGLLAAYLEFLSGAESRAQLLVDEINSEILAIEEYLSRKTEKKLKLASNDENSVIAIVKNEATYAAGVISEAFSANRLPPEKKETEIVTREQLVAKRIFGIPYGKKTHTTCDTNSIVSIDRKDVERQVRLLFTLFNKISNMLRKGALARYLLSAKQLEEIEARTIAVIPDEENWMQRLRADFNDEKELREENAVGYRVVYRKFMKELLDSVTNYFDWIEKQVVQEYFSGEASDGGSDGERLLKQKLALLQQRINDCFEALEIISRLQSERFLN